jgi:hypothetical protein
MELITPAANAAHSMASTEERRIARHDKMRHENLASTKAQMISYA